MMYSLGDNAIRAQLGFLEETDAPEPAELALSLVFRKDVSSRTVSFWVGKSSSHVGLLENREGCCKDIDANSSMTVAVDIAAIEFGAERKATPWKKLVIMSKDSLSGLVDFSDKFIYARWRV